MLNIKCKNQRVEDNCIISCNRLLLTVSDGIIDYIRTNPDEKLILRCSNCDKSTRWSEIKTVNNKLSFSTINKPLIGNNDLIFDELNVSEVI